MPKNGSIPLRQRSALVPSTPKTYAGFIEKELIMVSSNYYPQFPKKRKYTWSENRENLETVPGENVGAVYNSSLQISHSATTSDMHRFTDASAVASPFKKRKFISNSEETATNYLVQEIFWRPWSNEYRVLQKSSQLNLASRHKESPSETQWRKCKLCPQKFTRRDNLTRHWKSKHGAKSRPGCQFCFKTLSRKDAVLRHELNCHRNLEKRKRQSSANYF